MKLFFSTVAGAAFFLQDSVSNLLSSPKKTLSKWTIAYLAGLIIPGLVMTLITKDEKKDFSAWFITQGVLSYIFLIILINISYLLLVDLIMDLRFKKKQTKRAIMIFCSSMNFYNIVNATVKAAVFYLIIHHSYDILPLDLFTFSHGTAKPEIADVMYTLFLFLFWWQWMVEAYLFSQIYSVRFIFSMPVIVLCRLLSFTIMIIIGSKLWVGIFNNLGIPLV